MNFSAQQLGRREAACTHRRDNRVRGEPTPSQGLRYENIPIRPFVLTTERFSTVVKNLRRIENWFHGAQFFYVDVTANSVSLRCIAPRGGGGGGGQGKLVHSLGLSLA